MHVAAQRQILESSGAGAPDMVMAHLRGRCHIAGTDAGRAQDPHIGQLLRLHLRKQLLRAGQHAAQAVADADGDLRRARLAVADHIEVGVEGRDLIDLRHRDAQLGGQGLQVLLGQAALRVLDQVQVLDEQRALARPIAQQGLNRRHLVLAQHPPLGKQRRLAAAGARMDRTSAGLARAVRSCRAVFHARAVILGRLSFAACGGRAGKLAWLAAMWHTICQCPAAVERTPDPSRSFSGACGRRMRPTCTSTSSLVYQ